MSTEINTQLERIEKARDDMAQVIRDNRGTYIPNDVTVTELVPYVSALARQQLEEGYVEPSTWEKTVYPSAEYVGFSRVVVAPIPSKYKDVTAVDATAADVLSPKKIVDKNGNVLTGAIPSVEGGIVAPSPDSLVTVIDGGTYAKDRIEVAPIPTKYKDTSSGDAVAGEIISGKKAWVDGSEVTGTMTDRGAIDVKINPTVMPSKSYTIPKGYHDGNGKVSWEFTSSPTVYPTKEEQVVHSELGTVGMLSVTVKPIPSTYITTSDATASAGHIVDGETAYVDGKKVTGTLEKYDGSQLEGFAAGAEENNVIVATHFEDPNYVEGDSYVYSNVPIEEFGNATASDVRVGKTFTSSAGLKEDGTMPNVGVPVPTFTAQLDDDDDSGNKIWLRASVSQSAGYTAGGNKSTDIFPKLTVSGDTATMECGGVSISRKVGASIATCNVTVKFTTNAGNCLTSATTFANGAVSVFNSSTKSGEFTIPNVICGSALSINTQNMVSLYTSASQQPHNTLLGGTVKVPATAGQTYTIEVGMLDD